MGNAPNNRMFNANDFIQALEDSNAFIGASVGKDGKAKAFIIVDDEKSSTKRSFIGRVQLTDAETRETSYGWGRTKEANPAPTKN